MLNKNLPVLQKSTKRLAWTTVIEDFNKSGQKQTQYCKERNINKDLFYYYLRQWRKSNISIPNKDPLKHAFIPVEITVPKDSKFVLKIADGISLELPENMPIEKLTSLILDIRNRLC